MGLSTAGFRRRDARPDRVPGQPGQSRSSLRQLRDRLRVGNLVTAVVGGPGLVGEQLRVHGQLRVLAQEQAEFTDTKTEES